MQREPAPCRHVDVVGQRRLAAAGCGTALVRALLSILVVAVELVPRVLVAVAVLVLVLVLIAASARVLLAASARVFVVVVARVFFAASALVRVVVVRVVRVLVLVVFQQVGLVDDSPPVCLEGGDIVVDAGWGLGGRFLARTLACGLRLRSQRGTMDVASVVSVTPGPENTPQPRAKAPTWGAFTATAAGASTSRPRKPDRSLCRRRWPTSTDFHEALFICGVASRLAWREQRALRVCRAR